MVLTNIKKALPILILAVLLVPGTVFGYAQDDLSRSESGVYYYNDEIDPDRDELAEVELQLRDSNRNSMDEDVYFYVQSDRDDVELYYDSDGEYSVDYLRDNIWIVETDHRRADFHRGEFMPFWVESSTKGELELTIGISRRGGSVIDIFTGSRYGGEIEIEVKEPSAEHYQIYTPDLPYKAGDSYTIEALVRDEERGDRVEGVEVVFYERKEKGSWEEIGTDTTSSDGWAEIQVSNEEAADYEYTAETRLIDREYDQGTVSVAAAEPSDIEAMDEEINIDERREKIYFRLTDGYGNINQDLEHGLDLDKYRESDVEDFDYRERLEVTAVDPDGEEIVYEEDDIGYSESERAMYAEVDFDSFGEWEVEGRITGTTITASTWVNVKEFGEITDMELVLDNQVMRNFPEGPGDYNFDHYGEQRATVKLYDEDGVWIEYDFVGGDIRFRSSDERVARVSTRDGDINPRRVGEAEISAVHDDKGIEASEMLYLSNEPETMESEVEYDPEELSAKITLTMLDDDDLKAKPGEFETYTEDGVVYVDEFVDHGGYEVSTPDEITIEDKMDFQDGEATFTVTAEEPGSYDLTAYSDIDLSEDISLEFEEERKIEMHIDSTTAIVDGEEEEMELAPQIKDDRTFLPFRVVGELLGVEVDWDEGQQRVDGVYGDTEVWFFIDRYSAYINEEPHELDAVPYIDEDHDRTMIPFRFFAEAFGFEVDWDPDERKITVEM